MKVNYYCLFNPLLNQTDWICDNEFALVSSSSRAFDTPDGVFFFTEHKRLTPIHKE